MISSVPFMKRGRQEHKGISPSGSVRWICNTVISENVAVKKEKKKESLSASRVAEVTVSLRSLLRLISFFSKKPKRISV
jgi:hypothetical protein